MQIHEITKGHKRTDEGILDDLKAAVTATKTGYKQGGLAGVAKNLTSRTAYNQALQQNQRASTMKDLDKLEKKWGTQIKRPLSYYVDQLQNPTKPEFKQQAQVASRERQQLEPEFTDTFINDEPATDQSQASTPNQVAGQEPGDVLPDPGQALVVELPAPGQKFPSKYYKTANGKWYNENGQQLPKTSITKLENLIDQDQYKQVPIPNSVPGGQVTPDTKGKSGKKAVQESTPAKKGRANLKADFLGWISNQMGSDYQTVIANSTVKSELNKIFNAMTQNKDPKMASELFRRYVLIVQAAILKSKVEQGIENDEGQSPNDDAVARLKGKAGKKTGNPEADHILQSLGMTLNEGQVAVSKDIHVKSPKGDYVKRASDQQWYDPNGILISQEKYPDFIKKLDATPAAQTAYQAALSQGGGSDTAFIQAKVDAQVKAKLDAAAKEAAEQAAAAHPPPPPPQATAADYAAYQAEKMRINNQMLQQTKNDLLYAEWFNTGQQDYLQKQFAALIGTK